MPHDPVEAFLNQLHHPMLAAIDLSLDRMHRLLAMLGSPHKRLPPVIHVAGTNGKGSLLAYLQAILQRAGYKVHRYTSPHLVHFRERIVLDGKEIEDAHLVNIVKHVAAQLPSQPATFFEATTAVAFLAFAERKADVLLLETGLGGRLDATNVIEKPLLTAITPIAMDHMEYLGNTLLDIAAEKAGILKAGVPCVIGRQEEAVQTLLEQKAATLNTPLYCFGKDWQCKMQDTQGEYMSAIRKLIYTPSLPGAFQYDNAATAIACLDKLPQFKVGDKHIQDGIASAVWPARIQKIEEGRYAALMASHRLYLDGGHNPQGGQVLGNWLSKQREDVYLICGMMKGKDVKAYLASIVPHATAFYAVAIPNEADSHKPEHLQHIAQDIGGEAHMVESIEKALQVVAARAKKPSLVCICGSLYLAGYVLSSGVTKAAA